MGCAMDRAMRMPSAAPSRAAMAIITYMAFLAEVKAVVMSSVMEVANFSLAWAISS